TVDQPGGQDRGLAGASLTTEERAGDPARGVHALLDVDRQGEEVDGVARGLRGGGGGEQHGVAVEVDGGRGGGLLGEQPRLEADGVLAVCAVVDDGFREFETRSFHGQAPFGWCALPPTRAGWGPSRPPAFDRGPRGRSNRTRRPLPRTRWDRAADSTGYGSVFSCGRALSA